MAINAQLFDFDENGHYTHSIIRGANFEFDLETGRYCFDDAADLRAFAIPKEGLLADILTEEYTDEITLNLANHLCEQRMAFEQNHKLSSFVDFGVDFIVNFRLKNSNRHVPVLFSMAYEYSEELGRMVSAIGTIHDYNKAIPDPDDRVLLNLSKKEENLAFA